MAHTVRKALQSTVSAVTWAPVAVLSSAARLLHLGPAPAVSSSKGRAMSLSDALKGVTDNVVDTVVHYVPVSPAPGAWEALTRLQWPSCPQSPWRCS